MRVVIYGRLIVGKTLKEKPDLSVLVTELVSYPVQAVPLKQIFLLPLFYLVHSNLASCTPISWYFLGVASLGAKL